MQTMVREIILLLFYLHNNVHGYFDFELYHNLTEDSYGSFKKAQINKLAAHGFGRILTWNVKKLGACLRQDNVDQLKEVVCVILQSANVVALQEAENLDLSCLPCSTALKDEYEWPGDSANDEFRVFIKTRHSRSFSIKKYGVCDIGTDEPGKKSHFDDHENIYQTVMREYQRQAEKKEHADHERNIHAEREHSAFNKEATKQESLGSHSEPNNFPTDDDEKHADRTEQMHTHRQANRNNDKYSGKPEITETPEGVFMAQKIRKITEYDDKEKSKADEQNSALRYDDVDNLTNRDKQESGKDKESTRDKEKEEEVFPNSKHDEKLFSEKVHNMSQRFRNYAQLSNKNFRKYSKQRRKQFADVGNDAGDEKTDDEMSERQMERFHNNEDTVEEKIKSKDGKNKKQKQSTQKQLDEENLKHRLYKTREKLNDAKNKEVDAEKFKEISTQLKKIENEINELNSEHQKDNRNEEKEKLKSEKSQNKPDRQSHGTGTENKDEGKNERFNSPSEDSKEKLEKHERFKNNKEGEVLVNTSLSENKEEKNNKLNRFFDDVKSSQADEKTTNDELAPEPLQYKTDAENEEQLKEQSNTKKMSNKKESQAERSSKNEQEKQINDERTVEEPEKSMEEPAKAKNSRFKANDRHDENEKDSDLYTRLDNSDKILSGIDIDSDKMHNLVNKVLLNSQFIKADDESRNEDRLERLTSSKHNDMLNKISKSRGKRSIKKRKSKSKKGTKKTVKLTPEKPKTDKAFKRQMFSPNRDESLIRPKNLNYVILTVKSDLNSGEPFIIANVKFPKETKYQRACMEKIIADISTVNSEFEKRAAVLIMGDFHYDRLSGADNKGELYKMNTNLQVDGENYHAPILYLERDPITTVYGRRFDNILTNINIKGNMKTIGPDFPLEPESVILPITLQRLYNNYITSLYTTDNDDSDKVYDCMKGYMMSGKRVLDTDICKTTWVPSSYISDHLPLQFNVKMNVPGKSTPIEIKLASWNIQGDTFKERLFDPVVRRGFLTALKKYHVAIFHEFPPHDRIIDDQELGSSDIVRLRQGQVTTEFGIYVSENVKDGETDMYVLRKKFKNDNSEASEEEILSEPTVEEARNLITTVGLFAPKIVVDTVKIRPCFYTVKTSKTQTSGVDFSRIINAIDKDVQERKCDFKVMLASLNLEENFDLDKEIYKSFKYINLKCLMNDGDNKFKYNIPRSRDLADYVIVLAHENDFEFGDCTIGLPGDEITRGIDKLSDFEELTTHYPLSMVIKQSFINKK